MLNADSRKTTAEPSTSAASAARKPAAFSRYHSPYLNKPTTGLPPKRNYLINTPPIGMKTKAFPGIDTLHQLHKQVNSDAKIHIVPSIPDSLSSEKILLTRPQNNPSRTRYILRIPKRAPLESSIVSSTQMPIPDPSDSIQWNLQPHVEFHCSDSTCFWKGHSEAEFNEHIRRHHPRVPTVPFVPDVVAMRRGRFVGRKSSGVRCSECEMVVYSRALLLKHMGTDHDIALPSFSRCFNSDEELQFWLAEIRDAFCVTFVTGSGPKQWSSGARVSYLVCSHTGDVKERPTKKFCRPTRRTIKCGKTCTAYLKMRKIENDLGGAHSIAVEGCLYHTGHIIDPARILLTSEEMDAVLTLSEKYGPNALHLPIPEIREFLGPNAPRFRLIEDDALLAMLPSWIVEAERWKFKPSRRTAADEMSDTIMFPDSAPPVHEPLQMYTEPALNDQNYFEFVESEEVVQGEEIVIQEEVVEDAAYYEDEFAPHCGEDINVVAGEQLLLDDEPSSQCS